MNTKEKNVLDSVIYSYSTSGSQVNEENRILKETVNKLKEELDKFRIPPLMICEVRNVFGKEAIIRLPNGNQFYVDISEDCGKVKPGDVVLDPFCGCGTAVHAAQKLGRKWIGMDVTYLAIGLVKKRMQDAFPKLVIEEDGVPVDLTGALALADHDKYQFQWWALLRLGAVPVSGKKKGADKGIDGVIPILTGGTAEKPTYDRVIVSVKGGANVGVSMLRDLNGTLRDEDPVGIFLTLAEPTKPMKEFAAGAGFFSSKLWAKKFPRIQIITVQDMFDGKTPDIPWGKSPFAKAAMEKEDAQQPALDIES